MKRILYLVNYDVFLPFYWQLSAYLGERGYAPYFAAFLPRERLWLRKNGAPAVPADVYAVRNHPVNAAIFDEAEAERILAFAMQKAGGEKRDWHDRLLRVATILDELLASTPFDAVLIWNGEDYIGKALATLARRRGVKTVFAENGCLPNTLQLDAEGVNVRNSAARATPPEIRDWLEQDHGSGRAAAHPREPAQRPPDFRLRPLAPLRWPDLLRCFAARKTDPDYYRHFPEHRGASWFTTRWLRFRQSRVPVDRQPMPGKFILIAFQVHDDTQILLNSPLFRSMEEFFEFCHRAISRSFGSDYRIVVKEHPEDLCRYSYDGLRERYPDVLWLRKCSIDPLLEHAACVFVVNSSVGLQALEKGRPTIVLGDAFYAKDELVFRVEDPARIDEVVARARRGVSGERKQRIDEFMRYLARRCFVQGGWKALTPAGIANAGDRILDLIEPATAARARAASRQRAHQAWTAQRESA